MAMPPLVRYKLASDYRDHYISAYCRSRVDTFDGIRVYFSSRTFDHAFYESSDRDGRKDVFSEIRAQRIDWIKATLENRQSLLFKGWNNRAREYYDIRRVAVVFESFVVVIALSFSNDKLKANFITCYQADESIGRIKGSPEWSRTDCIRELKGD